MCGVSLSKQFLWLQMNRLSFMLKSWAESLLFMSAFHARALPEAISNRHCIISVCEQPAVDGWSVATVTNVLQLQLSPLRLPTMHSSSSQAFSRVPRLRGPALPFTYKSAANWYISTFNFQETFMRIYNLQYMAASRHTMQCSSASVGLAHQK